MRAIIDSHLDLAWNAVEYDRDLTLPLDEVRSAEAVMEDLPSRGRSTVTLPELRRARVLVAVATVLARGGPRHVRQKAYRRTDLDHATHAAAHCAGRGQLAWYQLMERRGELILIGDRRQLAEHWQRQMELPEAERRLGVVLSIEGTDPIGDVDELALWWNDGLRLMGLAHYGESHDAGGTGTDGPLTPRGRRMLQEMERLGMVLDVTHLCDTSMAEALDAFGGPVIASHHNCRALVPGDRQLTDDQIRQLVGRGAVIGMALDAWMLYPGWQRGVSRPEAVSIQAVADHVDHVCQLVGSVRHVGIGSDLDGGFGTEQTPHDVQSIADLHRLEEILAARGYASDDIDRLFYGNWLDLLLRVLP